MRLRTRPCPNCGAPLQAEWATRVIDCDHCHMRVTVEDDVVMAKGFRRALSELELPVETRELARVRLAGLPYRVLGQIAHGESTDVFLAERAHRLTERVVLKILRAKGDADLLDQEWETLTALHASQARGNDHFSRRLPQLVAHGELVRVDGTRVPASALRFMSGFVHTADDLLAAYPGGVDGEHGVWLWRRLLELLAWVHGSGFVHGAILPRHVLIHARDHGAMLLGWSCAGPIGASLCAISAKDAHLYPPGIAPGAIMSVAHDLTMSARVLVKVVGGDPATGSVPSRVPAGIAKLMGEVPRGELSAAEAMGAHELHSRVGAAAEEAYGPPKFVPLLMPEG